MDDMFETVLMLVGATVVAGFLIIAAVALSQMSGGG